MFYSCYVSNTINARFGNTIFLLYFTSNFVQLWIFIHLLAFKGKTESKSNLLQKRALCVSLIIFLQHLSFTTQKA